MATFVYNYTKQRFLEGNYDPVTANHFLILVMSDGASNVSSALTEYDVTNLGAFTDLQEHDGGTYARKAVTMASSATAAGSGTNTGATGFSTIASTSSTVTFTTPGAGTYNTVGALLYTGVIGSASDGTNAPVAYFDLTGGGSGFATNSSADVVVQWNASGILKMA